MADIDRTELYSFIEKSIRLALERKYTDVPAKNINALVEKAVKAVLAMDSGSRIRASIGHGGSGGKIEATKPVRVLIEHIQKELKPVTRQGVRSIYNVEGMKAFDEMASLNAMKERGASEKVVAEQEKKVKTAMKKAKLVEVNGLIFWEEEWKAIKKELKANKPVQVYEGQVEEEPVKAKRGRPRKQKVEDVSGRYETTFGEEPKKVETEPQPVTPPPPPPPNEPPKPPVAEPPEEPKKPKAVKPEPIKDLKNYPEVARAEQDLKDLRDKLAKGEKVTPEEVKTAEKKITESTRKAKLVKVDGVYYTKEQWKTYEKLLKENAPEEAELKATPIEIQAKGAGERELSDTKKIIAESEGVVDVSKVEEDLKKKINETFEGKLTDEELNKATQEALDKVAQKTVGTGGKELTNKEYYTSLEATGKKATELIGADKESFAKLSKEDAIKKLEEELKQSVPDFESLDKESVKSALESVLYTQLKDFKIPPPAKEQPERKEPTAFKSARKVVTTALEEQGEVYKAKSPEEVTEEFTKRISEMFGNVLITPEEILGIVREEVDKFFSGQVTSESVKETVSTGAKKPGIGDENVKKDKEQEQPKIDYAEQEKKLKARVIQIFEELGKSLGRAVPEEAVNEVVKSMKGAGGNAGFAGTFNEVDYFENAVQKGAPATAYPAIRSEMAKLQVLPTTPEGKQTRRGSVVPITEKEVALAERYLERLVEVERTTMGMVQRHPTMAKAFQALDPKFLEDPNRKLRIHTEQSTGTTIGKASYVDDLGIIQQATVAVDKYKDTITTTTNRNASFFQGIARDVREFTKWSIAIALVYTPMQKLKELIDSSIKSQSLLADTIVTLGETQEATNKIFTAASDIASETGESIHGVIEGYNLALRATGDIADRTERYAVANQLLSDSIMLSKMANISQAEATDILAASLRQTGKELDEGQFLLDKWVKVTRVANVDLKTLATSFSIVGDAADKAGLDIDELNGLIALMASQTGLSAKETGNAVRALISGYVSDPVVKELNKFGIAVKDTKGDARDFQDVMMDIRNSFKSGFISESQLGEIASDIGGGNRRQAQAVTTIVNLDVMNRVAMESAIAHGEAQRALAIELDTVQTKATLLSNSFIRLGQVLGTEGGALSGISDMLGLLTKLTERLGDVTGFLGTAAPALGLLGAGSFLLKGKPGMMEEAGMKAGGWAGGLLGNIGGNLTFPIMKIMEKMTGIFTPQTRGEWTTQTKESLALRGSAWGKSHIADVGNVLAAGTMAYLRASKGDWEGFGLVAGAGLMAGVAGKKTIWATVGSTIASIIANQIEKTLGLIGKQPIGGTPGLTGEASQQELQTREAQNALINLINEKSGTGTWASGLVMGMAKWGQELLAPITGQKELNETEMAIGWAARQGATADEINKALDLMATAGLEGALFRPSAFTTDVERMKEQGKGIDFSAIDIEDEQEKARTGLREEFYDVSNQMSPAAFRRRAEILTGVSAVIEEWSSSLTIAGADLDSFAGKAETVAELYARFGEIVMYGTDEQIDFINTQSTAIKDVYNKLEVARTKAGTEEGDKLIHDLELLLEDLVDTFPKSLVTTMDQITLNKVTLPGVERYTDLGEEGFNTALELAKGVNEKFKDALTEQERIVRAANLKNLEKLIEIAPGIYKRLTGEIADVFSEAVSLGKEENLIASKLGIQELDITKSQIPELESLIDKYRKLVVPLGYEEDKENFIARFADDQFDLMQQDQTLLQLALQELIDVNKKEMEGIYNLPANGSFFVPFQARQIEPGATSGIDTANLEAGVDNAGNQVKLAIELAAAQIADAILVEKMVSETTPDRFTNVFEEILNKQFGPPLLANTHEQDVINSGMPTTHEQDVLDAFKIPDTHEQDVLNSQSETGWDKLQEFLRQVLTQDVENPPEFESLFYKWMKSLLVPKDFWGDPKKIDGGRRQQQSQISPFLPMSGVINTSPVSNNLRDSAISQANKSMPASQQRLNLNISSNVNLRLDGRMVANVVKRYLGESLLRYSSSSGSISRSVIV